MDWRVPALLIFGGGLAFWTWKANKSGKLTIKFSRLDRREQPNLFRVALWSQAITAALAVLGAVACALGWIPENSN